MCKTDFGGRGGLKIVQKVITLYVNDRTVYTLNNV